MLRIELYNQPWVIDEVDEDNPLYGMLVAMVTNLLVTMVTHTYTGSCKNT